MPCTPSYDTAQMPPPGSKVRFTDSQRVGRFNRAVVQSDTGTVAEVDGHGTHGTVSTPERELFVWASQVTPTDSR